AQAAFEETPDYPSLRSSRGAAFASSPLAKDAPQTHATKLAAAIPPQGINFPGVIVHKEILHQQPPTPEQMAALSPAAGEPQDNEPLIPLPPAAAPAPVTPVTAAAIPA